MHTSNIPQTVDADVQMLHNECISGSSVTVEPDANGKQDQIKSIKDMLYSLKRKDLAQWHRFWRDSFPRRQQETADDVWAPKKIRTLDVDRYLGAYNPVLISFLKGPNANSKNIDLGHALGTVNII